MLVAPNAINSILYFISIFISSAILFIFINGDFIGILLLIIYIGAIAVLFLFIIMMINIKKTYYSFFYFLYNLVMFLVVLIIQLCYHIFYYSLFSFSFDFHSFLFNIIAVDSINSTNKNHLLLNIGIYIFINNTISILFISMLLTITVVGAISLTNFKSGFSNRKQYNQIERNDRLYLSYYY